MRKVELPRHAKGCILVKRRDIGVESDMDTLVKIDERLSGPVAVHA